MDCLYKWQAKLDHLEPGEEAPRTYSHESSYRQPVHRLKRLLAEKSLEVDFFKGALQKVKARRQKSGDSGEMASTTRARFGASFGSEHHGLTSPYGEATGNCRLRQVGGRRSIFAGKEREIYDRHTIREWRGGGHLPSDALSRRRERRPKTLQKCTQALRES
jgi:hypothetical protein